MWTCPHCNGKTEDEFQICWTCRVPKGLIPEPGSRLPKLPTSEKQISYSVMFIASGLTGAFTSITFVILDARRQLDWERGLSLSFGLICMTPAISAIFAIVGLFIAFGMRKLSDSEAAKSDSNREDSDRGT